jgi:hypothetical protein
VKGYFAAHKIPLRVRFLHYIVYEPNQIHTPASDGFPLSFAALSESVALLLPFARLGPFPAACGAVVFLVRTCLPFFLRMNFFPQ